MGFYLNGKYVSDSYLRFNLLHNNKSPGIDEEVNGNEPTSLAETVTDDVKELLKKLNLEITEVSTDNLLNRLKDMLNKENIDAYSTLTSLTKNHLLAILYLLYEGRITERQIMQVIASTNYKTRTELLLAFLKEPANTSKVDFFKPLFNHTEKMTNYINPYELTSSKADENFKTVSNTKINLVNQYMKFGNYYYAGKGSLNPLNYCDGLAINSNVHTNAVDIILPDSKYTTMLKSNKFNPNAFDRNQTRVTILDLFVPVYSWLKVIDRTALEIAFNKQNDIDKYIYNENRFLFKYEKNPAYSKAFDAYRDEIDRGFGLLNFVTNELEKDKLDAKYFFTYFHFLDRDKLGYDMYLGKRGNSTSFDKNININISNVYMYALNELLFDYVEAIFPLRSTIGRKRLLYQDTSFSDILEKVKVGYKAEFDNDLIELGIPDTANKGSNFIYRYTLNGNKKIKNRNVFKDHGLYIHSENIPEYMASLTPLFNEKAEAVDTLQSDVDFLSNVLCVQREDTSYYSNLNVSQTLKDISKLDLLITDTKEIKNFGTTNLNNILKDLATQIVGDISVTTVELINQKESVRRTLRDNFKKLTHPTEISFYDMYLFYIAKEILGNYLTYIFPDIGLDAEDGRMCTIESFETLKEIFNITNTELDPSSSSNSDIVKSTSLYATYSRIFKMRHFIINLKAVETKIIQHSTFVKLLNDPCNCNNFFEGASQFAENLHATNYFFHNTVDALGCVSRKTFDSYKTTIKNNDKGGIIKC